MNDFDRKSGGRGSDERGEVGAEVIRTSRAAWGAFILGLLSFGVSFIAAAPGLVAGIVGLANIRRSEGRLKGRGLAIGGMACCFLSLALSGTLWMFSWDAEPLAEDYAVEDLVYAGAEYDETWELIKGLEEPCEESDSVVREIRGLVGSLLEEPDGGAIADVLSGYAETIEQLWEQAAADRGIVSRLAAFEYINDLSERDVRRDKLHRKISYVQSLYFLYAVLEASRGNDLSACEALAEINNVTRKLCVSSRATLTKLTCFTAIGNGLQVAAFIVNSKETSEAALDSLKGWYVPLSKEETSVRNCIIFEYLAGKVLWEEMLPGDVISLMAKRNSYMRVLKNICEEQLAHERKGGCEPLCVWPRRWPYRPSVSGDGMFTGGRLYARYNPVGSMLLVFAAPTASPRVSEWIRAKDDMFGILLAMRMGQEYSLEARDGGDDYVIDTEQRIIYRPGSDGRPNTRLPINPEVLSIRQR